MASSDRRLPVDRPRKRLVKAEAESSVDHGKRPDDRTVDERLQYGVINLDKPSGPSSHQVAAWLRDIFQTDKVGHGGTLDPKVTGLLPTAVNQATRGVGALLTAGKEYLGVMRLHGDADFNDVQKAARSLEGRIEQTPPVRSAVKRRRRKRTVYYLDALEMDGRDVLFRVGCEAGTYIRNLCIDWGKGVGARGHMQQLRRSRSGPFTLDDAVTLQDVQDAWILHTENDDSDELLRILRPHEALFGHLPKLVVRDSAIGAVCHGAPLAVPGVVAVDSDIENGDLLLIESLKGEAVALADAKMPSRRIHEEEKGVAADPNRILMPKSTYPKIWKRDGRS